MRPFLALLSALLLLPFTALAQEGEIILQSTTSTQNSGLYEYLLPLLEKDTGLRVKVVAVGTGQALKNARNCDGDVLLVHAKDAEEEFVAREYGLRRHDVMYNDFVLIGPADDPAGVRGAATITEALQRIAAAKAPFASRGDDSGTHRKELALWKAAGLDPGTAREGWYRETGSGMGATLNIAAGMGAYALSDRATWISFGNREGLAILHEGDPALFNQYGVIAVNPARCGGMNTKGAETFIRWILSPEGQEAIAAYRLNGQQLFFPNAQAE